MELLNELSQIGKETTCTLFSLCSVTTINANAICLVCGTAKEDSVSGCCINGHDNWLEEDDSAQRFLEGSEKFNKSISELIFHILNNVSITDR